MTTNVNQMSINVNSNNVVTKDENIDDLLFAVKNMAKQMAESEFTRKHINLNTTYNNISMERGMGKSKDFNLNQLVINSIKEVENNGVNQVKGKNNIEEKNKIESSNDNNNKDLNKIENSNIGFKKLSSNANIVNLNENSMSEVSKNDDDQEIVMGEENFENQNKISKVDPSTKVNINKVQNEKEKEKIVPSLKNNLSNNKRLSLSGNLNFNISESEIKDLKNKNEKENNKSKVAFKSDVNFSNIKLKSEQNSSRSIASNIESIDNSDTSSLEESSVSKSVSFDDIDLSSINPDESMDIYDKNKHFTNKRKKVEDHIRAMNLKAELKEIKSKPIINKKSQSIVNQKDYVPIYKRYPEIIKSRKQKELINNSSMMCSTIKGEPTVFSSFNQQQEFVQAQLFWKLIKDEKLQSKREEIDRLKLMEEKRYFKPKINKKVETKQNTSNIDEDLDVFERLHKNADVKKQKRNHLVMKNIPEFKPQKFSRFKTNSVDLKIIANDATKNSQENAQNNENNRNNNLESERISNSITKKSPERLTQKDYYIRENSNQFKNRTYVKKSEINDLIKNAYKSKRLKNSSSNSNQTFENNIKSETSNNLNDNKYVNKKYNLEKYEATKGMVHNKGELIDRNENERTSRDISYIQNNSNSGFGFSTFDNFHNNSNHIPTTNKQKMITEYDKIDEENYDEINYQIENQDQNNSYPNQFHNNLQQNSNLNQDENLKNINKYNNIINNNTISNNQFENNFTHAKNTEASKGSKKNSRLKNSEESKVSSILKVNNVTKNNVKSNSTNEINFKDSSDLNEVLLKSDLNSIKIASSKYLNLSNANLNLSMEDKLHLINNVDFDKVFYGAFKSDIDLKYKQSLYQNQSKTSIN